jgi:Zn-dependent protease with chaperone function
MTQYKHKRDPGNSTPLYEPNQRQLERQAALHRFNSYYVFLPLGVLTLLAAAAVILLLIGIFSPSLSGAAAYASALADITIILFVLPQLVLLSLGPALLIGLIFLERRRRQAGRPRFDDGGKLQVWLWRLDLLLQRAQQKTAVSTTKAAEPIITFQGWLAYADAFRKRIYTYLKRS